MKTNTELLCLALGWQGGTVHQVAEETGLTVEQIINTDRSQEWIDGEYSINYGWLAVRTCSPKFNKEVNFPANKGFSPRSLAFWMGVARGMEFTLTLQGKS